MRKIAIDHMPLENNPLYSNDFCSYYIFSRIMYPLFTFDGKKIVKNACKSITIKKNKYIIKIKDNINFYNGRTVTVKDYYDSFVSVMGKMCYGKYLLENVKKIYIDNDQIIIILKRKDLFFLDKLSYYSFSPFEENLTCGPYYVETIGKDIMILKKNIYYEDSKEIKSLEFVQYRRNDVRDFLNNKLDMTNITTFPLKLIEKLKPEVHNSNLMFVLKFNSKLMSKKYRNVRRYILSAIDKEKLNHLLNDVYIVKNDFSLNDEKYNYKRKVSKFNSVEKLTLGYTNYYPNKIIVDELQRQFLDKKVNVELVQYNLCEKNNCDIYIDIVFSPFFFKESFYLSKYFKIVNGKKYKILCNIYEQTKNKLIYKKIMKRCNSTANIIPLLRSKYIYLRSSEMKKTNQNKVNFYEM